LDSIFLHSPSDSPSTTIGFDLKQKIYPNIFHA
jgi:hypothetical protein